MIRRGFEVVDGRAEVRRAVAGLVLTAGLLWALSLPGCAGIKPSGPADVCRALEAVRVATCATASPSACDAAVAALQSAGCAATPPTTLPSTPPSTLPPVPPTTLPTPPPAASGCVLAGADGLEGVPGHVQALGPVVNATMAELTGCDVGGDCLIRGRTVQGWQAEVEAGLRARGYCAGQHEPGTDEIAASGDGPTGTWEGFHVAAGTPETRLTVVWSYGTQTEPVPATADRPEHYVGANRPAWRHVGTPGPETPISSPSTPTSPAPVVPIHGGLSDGCGLPDPPPPYRINVYVHRAFCATLDSTLLVQGADYCASVGYTDGRSVCAVRAEGYADRAACEERLKGHQPLVWSCEGAGCQVYACAVPGNCDCGDSYHNVNPWQAAVVGAGTVRVCTADGRACGSVEVTP